MLDFFRKLFDSGSFLPRVYSYALQQGLTWLYVTADILLVFACFSVPLLLFYFARKRKDMDITQVMWLIGLSIMLRGITYIMDIVTIWYPVYRLDSVIRMVTALASIAASALLFKLIPKALAMPSRRDMDHVNQQMEKANAELREEIERRKDAETRLSELNRNLEGMVMQRTAELTRLTQSLRTEISRREVVEKELVESNERYVFLTNAVPQILWAATAEGEVNYYNDRWYEYTGLERGTAPLQSWNKLLPEEDLLVSRKAWQDALVTQEPLELEYRIRNQKGVYRHHLIRVMPMPDEQGKVRMWVGSATDIHDQKMAAISLQESMHRFRLLADSLPLMVWTTNAAGRNTYFNQCWYEYTRMQKNDRLSDLIWNYLLHPDDVELTREVWQAALAEGEPFAIEQRLKDANGYYRWFYAQGLPMRNINNEITGWLGTCMDIHEHKQKEEDLRRSQMELEERVQERTAELKKANIMLQRSNEELEQFAYVSSHDLKEPLRMVSVYAQLLERRFKAEAPVETHEYVGFITEGVQRMQTLIDDLLSYGRIERSQHAFRHCDMNEMVQKAILNLQLRIDETDAEVIYTSLPIINGIPSQLTSLFQNLIENSIKFRGKVRPLIHIQAEEQGSDWLFSLADNGIGIDEQYAERIFVIFQRLHSREEYPGTGIGLAVCKKIVELHGGRIWVKPAAEQGTVFYFTLPKVD